MKRFVLFIVTIVLAIASCTEEIVDYSIPDNISGTTWKCTTIKGPNENIEFMLFKFISTTTVESWVKLYNESIYNDGSTEYTIQNNTIEFNRIGSTLSGTIIGAEIHLNLEGEIHIFYKQ